MQKLIITAAISGAEVTQEHNPAVPYTVAEMVREAKLAQAAGASIIHLHVRWDDGTPTQDRERFSRCHRSYQKRVPGYYYYPQHRRRCGYDGRGTLAACRSDSGNCHIGLRNLQFWRRRCFREYRKHDYSF